MCFDSLDNIAVLLPGAPNTVRLTLEDGRRETLYPAARDGEMTRFVLPALPPYTLALLETEWIPGDA